MSKSKSRWREKVLFLSPALILVALLFRQFGGDRMDKAQRRLVGENAVDCGVGHMSTAENNLVYSQRSEADACAVAAFKADKPYRVRYDNKVEDAADGPEIHSSGSVRTPQGEVYFFYYSHSTTWWKKYTIFVKLFVPNQLFIREP